MPATPRSAKRRRVEDDIANGQLPTESNRSAKRLITTSLKSTSKEPSVEFNLLKSIVLSKLSSRRPIPLTNLSSEHAKVHTLISATVQSGESNSMLLIGARGSGKTTLINAALLDLSRSSKDHFHTVRLNGFVQTDDKLALREIWRQLGREMEIEDDAENGPGKSYADTLTMLLALLSHPDELPGQADAPENQVAKSVIFIMDEFDLFATHPRQTLLYNLLDIAQSRKAPIAVLGLTTRIDVTEALEKRVKSRFSHRYVHLPLPKGLGQFVEVGKAAMTIKSDELTFEENAVLSKKGGILEKWNKAVGQLFTDVAFQRKYISSIYHTTKSIPTLVSDLLIPTSSLTTLPEVKHYVQNIVLLTPPDSNLSLLPSLSSLALSLLISAARLTIIHSTESLNFNLAYGEYVSLASKARINSAAAGQLASGARLWGKEIARKEWEALRSLGLIIQTGGVGEMCRVDVALEEIPGAAGEGVLGKVREKWCKQI
ncbi:origin recognition complex, subunit 4 [Tothia fuscella]|uniref:Origin recognition complex subunit 4 n=1 Tax=Tothia fuscella TaxID=1048955 RepID=A0A9P4U012_9PEZI|nr:origin recognition complex, subunit 4 [Tothia fuscella]